MPLLPLQPGLRAALDRWQLPLAVALLAALLLPGLGRSGLLDPWEMDRAAVARRMAAAPRVLVVEAAAGGLLATLEKSSAALSLSHPFDGTERTAAAAMQSTVTRLGRQIAHAVVVDLDGVLGPNPDAARVEQVATQLAQIEAQNRGTALVLVTREARAATATAKTLREGLAAAQVKSLQQSLRGTPAGEALADPKLAEALAPKWAPGVALVPPDATAATLQANCPSPWRMPVFKQGGATVTVPWLEAAIVAASLRLFGPSETAARLPGALVAILLGLIVVFATRRLWGPTEAWLGLLVFATLPLTWGLARVLTFEVTAPLGVALVALGLALGVAQRLAGWGAWVAMGALLLFLGHGLAGLTMAAGIGLAYLLATGDRRGGPIVAALGLTAALGVCAAWVLSHPEDLLLRSLRFTQWPFGGGPGAVHRDFSWFIGQAGFGLFPWGAPFVLGLATLLGAPSSHEPTLASDRHRPHAALLAGILVPIVVLSVLVKEFNHFVLPLAPLAAVVTAAMLGDLLAGRISGRLVAVFVAFATLLLHREIGKGADAVTRFVAFDPPLQVATGDYLWPEELKLPRELRAVALLSVLAFCLGAAKPLETVQATLDRLRRPRAAAWTLGVLGILWLLDVLVSLGTRLDVLLKTEAQTSGYHYDRVWVTLQAIRPEVIAGAVAFALLLLYAAVTTGMDRAGIERRKLLRLPLHVGSLLLWTPIAFGVVAAAALAVLATGAMVPIAVEKRSWGEALAQSEALALGARSAAFLLPLGLAGLVLLLRGLTRTMGDKVRAFDPLQEDTLLGALMAGVSTKGLLAAGLLALLAVAGLGIGASQAAGTWTWPYLGSVWALFLALALVVLGHAGSRAGAYGWPLVGAGLIVAGSLAVPLAARYWQEVVILAEDPGAKKEALRYFAKLLVTAPDTGVLLGLALAVALIRIGTGRPRLDHVIGFGVRLVQGLEQPRVAAAALVFAGVVFSAGYAYTLLPGLSVHYSQKHLLQKIAEAGGSGRDLAGAPRTYTHGSTKAGSDNNFYTQSMPAIEDRQAVLALLAGQNVATRVTDNAEGGATRQVALPGWSDGVDANKDGKRDAPAWFGVATKVDGVRIEAKGAGWQPGAWTGAQVFAAEGPPLQVLDNTADSLTLAAPSALQPEEPLRGAFTIDKLQAPTGHDKHAAPSPLQRFVVVPKDAFSELNHAFRSAHGGKHVPVLDAASSRLVLATDRLQPGQEDQNWLRKSVITQAEFDKLEGVRKLHANFDDQLHLIGFKLADASVARSQKYKLTLYWRVNKPTTTSWKLFMHPHPLHLDRWPLTPPDPSEDENKPCIGASRPTTGCRAT